jgi:DNA-binding response OmpR family regulator
VSKEELLNTVWGGSGDLNTVEVYAGYLRRKLTAAFSDRVRVETVRWAGYQLVVQ